AYHATVAAVDPDPKPSKARGGKEARRPSPSRSKRRLGWREALASVDAWASLDDANRRAVVMEVVAHLNAEERGEGRFLAQPFFCGVAALGVVEDTRTGTELALIPAGHMIMGYAPDDIMAVMHVFEDEEMEGYCDWGWASFFTSSRPARPVAVSAFAV